MTIWTEFPTFTDPYCLAELVTITAMYSGSGPAGPRTPGGP